MDKHAVALVLEEIATLLEVSGDNRFKARAYRAAARAVDKLERDLADALASGELLAVAGIGPATARVIEELVNTGRSDYHETLRGRAPSGVHELLRVPGLGAQKIATLHAELGVRDLDTLEHAARSGAIAALRGFGERTQQRILEGIPFARGVSGRRRFHQVVEIAERVLGLVAATPGVRRAALAGDVRRRLETVSGIVVVAAVEGASEQLLAGLQRVPGVTWRTVDNGALLGRLADGVEVEVRFALPGGFGLALLLATGSERHIAALRPLAAAHGSALDRDPLLQLDADDESDVYAALGLPWIPPELRETGAEVELARAGALPELIDVADLHGCFHCHTTYSDGRATVEQMAEGALALGWRYLGIADHSRNAGYAGGLTPRQLHTQRRAIDAWNHTRGSELWLFAGVEADIMTDGALDYAAQGEGDVLDALDYVIGSVHSAFGIGSAAMTARLVRALEDPRLTMLGHATGRLLLTRDAYALDLAAVIARAAEVGAVLEINADPFRLDLSWEHWPAARERGVPAAINPDAHSVGALYNVRYGVNMARKAGLTRAHVVNAWPLDDVREFLTRRKRSA
jgi:DNA polymerase (family 10)